MAVRSELREGREDLSPYLIHLTRDDSRDPGGQPARENFLQILTSETISALRPHCMHTRSIKRLENKYQRKLNVCCFTECPLTQVHRLIGYRPGRRVHLEAYGFVFDRELLIERGAQPVVPVNSYCEDKSVRAKYDADFQRAVRLKFAGPDWQALAFQDAMHSGYDFSAEREWRHLGDFEFSPADLVAAIIPDGHDQQIREKLATMAIPMYHPGMSMDEMLREFRRQQKRTKRLFQRKKIVAQKQIA